MLDWLTEMKPKLQNSWKFQSRESSEKMICGGVEELIQKNVKIKHRINAFYHLETI